MAILMQARRGKTWSVSRQFLVFSFRIQHSALIDGLSSLLAGAWRGFDAAVSTTPLTGLRGLSPSSYLSSKSNWPPMNADGRR
jgi:hypothetical protein